MASPEAEVRRTDLRAQIDALPDAVVVDAYVVIPWDEERHPRTHFNAGRAGAQISHWELSGWPQHRVWINALHEPLTLGGVS